MFELYEGYKELIIIGLTVTLYLSNRRSTCNFDDKDDKQDYQKEKHDYFAAKPENQGYSDWEYDEEDK